MNVSFSKYISLLIVVLIASGLYSCGTVKMYDGEKRSRAEVAIIEGKSLAGMIRGGRILIRTFDGKPIKSGVGEIEVIPGEHELEVSCETIATGTTSRHIIKFYFEAGKKYVIHGVKAKGRPRCGNVLIKDKFAG